MKEQEREERIKQLPYSSLQSDFIHCKLNQRIKIVSLQVEVSVENSIFCADKKSLLNEKINTQKFYDNTNVKINTKEGRRSGKEN